MEKMFNYLKLFHREEEHHSIELQLNDSIDPYLYSTFSKYLSAILVREFESNLLLFQCRSSPNRNANLEPIFILNK